MKTLLSIAGFDPSSGAGITADLAVFAAHHLFGTSCITSLTVQSTVGVRSTHPVDTAILSDTLACLDEDLPADGIKIGMLATAASVAAVADFVERLRSRGSKIPIVIDSVIRSSSGKELLDSAGIDLLMNRLMPLADWITPNLDELASLTGISVGRRDQMLHAAEAIQKKFSRPMYILAKGGHLDSPDDVLLAPDGTASWLTGLRVETTSTHGTGCALSSAILCRLVLGDAPNAAAAAAKQYVTEALRRSAPIGRGRGPMNLLWPLGT